jgi:hypothetical protein
MTPGPVHAVGPALISLLACRISIGSNPLLRPPLRAQRVPSRPCSWVVWQHQRLS